MRYIDEGFDSCSVTTHWFAPFPLLPSVESKLLAVGLKRYSVSATPPAPPTLLVYDSPDRVLAGGRAWQSLPLSVAELLSHYRTLLALAVDCPLISGWCLNQLPVQAIRFWLDGTSEQRSSLPFPIVSRASFTRPPLDPLTAAVVSAFIQEEPSCLNAYLGLEGLAQSFGLPADTDYAERVSSSQSSSALLAQWWSAETCEPNLAVLQLRQVEDELISLFVTHEELKTQLRISRSTFRLMISLFKRQIDLFCRGLAR